MKVREINVEMGLLPVVEEAMRGFYQASAYLQHATKIALHKNPVRAWVEVNSGQSSTSTQARLAKPKLDLL